MFDFKVAEMQVDYVDHLGSDINVVNAARCSFAKEVKEFDLEKDSKLINYLAKHGHFTPLAHTSVTIRVKAPIFMARQFVKHQIGLCLSGDTEVTFVKKVKGVSNGTYTKKLSQIADMWFGKIKYQGGAKGQRNVSGSHIRVFNEDTQRFEESHIVNVIDSGMKDVYKVTDSFGNSIKATEDHQFLTDKGWKKVKELTIDDLLIRSDVGKTFSEKSKQGNTTLLPKYVSIASITLFGEEQCYDISVDNIHNFLGNGFVVHNCWNEESRRYIDDEPEFYIPKEWRGRPVNAKQGSNGKHPMLIEYGTQGEDGCLDLEHWFLENTQNCLDLYQTLVADKVAPEMARMVLPQNVMTNWMWTGSLVAFARVVKLRTDSHAQQEAQELGWLIHDAIKDLYPVSWKALMEN